MKIKRNKKSAISSSAALSDLAFLLIIYFIVIAGFNINKGFLMNLPAKNSTKFLLKDDIMRFELNSKGDIVFEGRRIQFRQAERRISEAVRERPNDAVVLTISPKAPWQNVVTFVELAQSLQIDSFSFKMSEDSMTDEGGEG